MYTKMNQKWISLFLCAAILLTMLPGLTFPARAEEQYALNLVNKPGTSFVLEHDHTMGVYDLWNEIDSEGSGELAFNQSFSVNINDAIEVYNNYLDNKYPDGERDHFKASEDINNNATFRVEARIWINGDNDFNFSTEAIYQLHPYDLRPYENYSYGKWSFNNNELSEEFFTMSADGGILNFSLNGTVKEIYDALKAQNEALGEISVNGLMFDVWVSCEVEYKDWYIKSNETHFESLSYSLYDKHIYESESEFDTISAIPVTAPIAVNVVPAYEGCYEPVQTEYNWYYEFIREGYDSEEDDVWYGYFERDESKESDVLTETAPSGTVFGVAYGTVSSDDKNYITLNDIRNNSNKEFINSFVGAKPRELGGNSQMFIVCVVTLTFADGRQYKLEIVKADYMSKFVAPCMHACTVCGFCTVKDEMLPCNFDQMYYDITNVCTCDEPSVPQYEVTRESESEAVIESTGMTVKVVVDKIEVEEIPSHAFVVNATSAVGEENVIALYNINIFDEYGYPYTLNQWGDMGEELTISVPVSVEEALAIQSGDAVLYHITAGGDAEEVAGVTAVIDGDTAVLVFTSDSFSPFVLARKPAPCTHSVLELQAANAPTCTFDGHMAYYVCTCGKYFEDDSASSEITDIDAWKSGAGKIPASGHDYTEQIMDPDHLKSQAENCTEFNLYWYGCKICAANAKDDVNAADQFYASSEKGEHSFGDWVITKPATASEAGEQQRSCHCGETETEAIPALGYAPGDVNHDGYVDGADAMLLRQFVARWKLETFYPENADLDGSGVIDGADAMLLRQQIAG